MRTRTKPLRALKQAGFTLIELIIVIVIIGIMAAVAIPKFQDLTVSAQNSTIKALAATLQTAGTLAYAKKQTDSTFVLPTTCTGLNDATYMTQVIATPYTVSGTYPSCTVTGPTGTTAVTVVIPN